MLKPEVAIKPLLNYKKGRGMNWFNDIVDWIGGFPYEYATVSEIRNYFKNHGFSLKK